MSPISTYNGQVCGAYALTEARDAVERCMASSGPTPLSRAKVLSILVQIAIAAGDLDVARDAVDELDVIAQTYASPFLRATAASARGRLHLQRPG